MNHPPLRTVSIDGFRGLRDLTLQNLGALNILVGANNSGKTSVLEALTILTNPLDPWEWFAMASRRDFGRLDETRVQSLRWSFRHSNDHLDPDAPFEAECRMTHEGPFPLRSLTAFYRDIVGQPDPAGYQRFLDFRREGSDDPGPIVERGAEIRHEIETDGPLPGTWDDGERGPIVRRFWEGSAMYLARTRPKRPPMAVETLTPYSYQMNQLQVSERSRRLFDHHDELVLELARDFDPDVRAVHVASFRGERPAIYIDHRRLGPAPLSIFGDGLRRAILLASTLPRLAGGGLLLIDEIEAGIHVNALQRVFAWLSKWSSRLEVQVVATTHSLEAIDALSLPARRLPEELVTYHLEQTDDGTLAKRIDHDLLMRLRLERGLDVR